MSKTLCWVLGLGCQEVGGEEGEGRWGRGGGGGEVEWKEREGREGYNE